MPSFAEQLSALNRKARLQGRALSPTTVSAAFEGEARTAGERLASQRRAGLEERRVDIQEEQFAEASETQKAQFAETLAQRKAEVQAELGVAGAAAAQQERQQRQTTVLASAGIGAYLAAGTATGGPVGAAVGLVVGLVATSFICTETYKISGLSNENMDAVARFRNYAKVNHLEWLNFYLKTAPELVKAIAEKEDTKAFYGNLKYTMILPVIVMTDSSHEEQAFRHYRKHLMRLFHKYTPHLFKQAIEINRADKKRFKEAA